MGVTEDRRGVTVLDPVVLGLRTGGVTGQAAALAQPVEALAPSGQDLVDVRLVARVPQEDVARRVEDAVQGEGELDDAEVRPEVPASDGHGLDDEGPDLAGEGRELLVAEPSDVGRARDLFEKHAGPKLVAAARGPRAPCSLGSGAVAPSKDDAKRAGRDAL